jgi:hypothetical protein
MDERSMRSDAIWLLVRQVAADISDVSPFPGRCRMAPPVGPYGWAAAGAAPGVCGCR